ncbi:MAG TPA: COX15/CtaA family protein [Caulobacteraceae bacterium]|jgi:cytochrome c oxidase assembly protein subunit 15|nr:COX15/CtaA family protein [Caulobacteraceae bacterium]
MVALSRDDGAATTAVREASRVRTVAVWLFVMAALVLAMVVVGGATRLTGSGLSITQWKPVSGALPPLTSADWADAFARYRASSQYRLVNQGISLGQFQALFWWEWAHRLLGRTIGVAFAVPLALFVASKAIPRRLWGRCTIIFVLGGLQGLVGWWMVESGLEGRASVAPERLAAHLGLALTLLASLVWTGLDAWAGPPAAVARPNRWASSSAILAAILFLQCLLGALVAGNHAGLIDSDWPLMAGRWFPEGYWNGGAWRTFVHGLQATQFDHRLFGYAAFACIVAMALAVTKSGRVEALRPWVWTMAGLAVVQIVLGVAVLRLGVPLGLALAHQANAALLFAASIGLAWRSRRGIILPLPSIR